jgi:hypothetical protein
MPDSKATITKQTIAPRHLILFLVTFFLLLHSILQLADFPLGLHEYQSRNNLLTENTIPEIPPFITSTNSQSLGEKISLLMGNPHKTSRPLFIFFFCLAVFLSAWLSPAFPPLLALCIGLTTYSLVTPLGLWLLISILILIIPIEYNRLEKKLPRWHPRRLLPMLIRTVLLLMATEYLAPTLPTSNGFLQPLFELITPTLSQPVIFLLLVFAMLRIISGKIEGFSPLHQTHINAWEAQHSLLYAILLLFFLGLFIPKSTGIILLLLLFFLSLIAQLLDGISLPKNFILLLILLIFLQPGWVNPLQPFPWDRRDTEFQQTANWLNTQSKINRIYVPEWCSGLFQELLHKPVNFSNTMQDPLSPGDFFIQVELSTSQPKPQPKNSTLAKNIGQFAIYMGEKAQFAPSLQPELKHE